MQSQKIQGFYVADFATRSDERRSRSKIFSLFIWIKEPCVRKFEGLARSKIFGILQTKYIFGKSQCHRGIPHLRACSHEPGTVNYPGASITSRSHDDLLSRGNVAPGQLHCPGASSSSSDHYEFI